MKPGLTMEVQPGTEVGEAAREAQRVADLTDRTVGFHFNSARCVAWPGGKADKLEELYSEAQRHEIVVYSNGSAVEIELKWDDR